MRKKPLSLFLASLIFLYFPLEYFWELSTLKEPFTAVSCVLSIVLPLILIAGLLRVTKVGWYTLVATIALWGIWDLNHYYQSRTTSVGPLITHLSIYLISLGYFINPRIRHLYFDPKLRWWRQKPRYETHLPFMMHNQTDWFYPVLRNISEGGCFIETPHLLHANDKIAISIPLPVPLGVSVIKTQGEVRWVSKNPLRQGMGIQFVNFDRSNGRAIREYVRQQL